MHCGLTQTQFSYVNMAKNREKKCNEIEIVTVITAATVECRPSIVVAIIIIAVNDYMILCTLRVRPSTRLHETIFSGLHLF